MATVVSTEKVTCDECGAVYIIQSWSCGCITSVKISPRFGIGCMDCQEDGDFHKCGKRGRPEEH